MACKWNAQGGIAMHLRLNVKSFRFYAAVTRQHQAVGVNSNATIDQVIPNGHIPMWDFDHVTLDEVCENIHKVQEKWDLGQAYIISTGVPDHYHAYCESVMPWAECVAVVTDTVGCDKAFKCMGYIRGYWTLRISAKRNRKFKLAGVLPRFGSWPEIEIADLSCGQLYWTSKR